MIGTPLEIRRLGRVEYADGLVMQEHVVESVAGGANDALLLLEHNDVLTLGRGASVKAGPDIASYANILFPPEQLARAGVELHETGRGGDVTFHGKGQVVGYPILNLARTQKDVRKFVRSLEEIMIRTAANFGVEAARDPEHPGVWVGANKLGAIGVRVSRWITSHGFAFNVSTDLARFDLIVPCGIRGRGVTSIERECDRRISLEEVEDRIEAHAAEVFARDTVRRDVEQTTIAVLVRRGDSALCLHRIPPDSFWQIITGGIERGETPAQAARRELLEETGFDAAVTPLGYEHAFSLAPGMLAREIVFTADVPSGAEPRLSEEHDELRWCPLDEARSLVRHAGHKRALHLAWTPRTPQASLSGP